MTRFPFRQHRLLRASCITCQRSVFRAAGRAAGLHQCGQCAAGEV